VLWLISEDDDAQYEMGTTDEAGDYSIDGLEEGDHLMQVLPTGDEGMSMAAGGQPTAPFSVMVDVGPGPVQRKDVDLPGGRLRAEVVDARTGEPIAGVRVVLERTDEDLPASRFLQGTGGRVGETYADEAGRVEFRHVAGGTYALLAGGTNIVGMGVGGWSTTRVDDIEVSESRSGFTVRIEMEPGGAVAGTVKDRASRPVSGIPVWARNDATGTWLSVLSETTTDNAGHYEVHSLDAGPWTLVFGGTSHALTVVSGVMVRRGQTTDLDVSLEPGVEIWVDTGPYTPSQLAATVVGSQGVVPTNLSSISSLLGQRSVDGRMRIGRVPAGAYEFWIRVGGEEIAHETVQRVEGSPHTVTLEE